MNEIIETIDSTESFEELGNLMQVKEFITSVSNIFTHIYELLKLKRNPRRDARIFLSAHMICKYPKDTLGIFDTSGLTVYGEVTLSVSEDNNILKQHASELIKQSSMINSIDSLDGTIAENFMQTFKQFDKLFTEWKQKDSSSLKQSLLEEYHHLSVQIMNEKDAIKKTEQNESEQNESEQNIKELIEQRIEVLENAQKELLDTAFMMGGAELVTNILQHEPVVIDMEQLSAQYSNAFWDVLYEEFVAKKYDKIFVVLQHIVSLFEKIYNGSKQEHTQKRTEINEKIDIELIRQQLAHDAYSSEQMYMLCMFIIAECKKLQAPQFDDVVDELYANLKEENFLPRFLREISVILQITTTDILEFREAARKTQGLDDSQNN